jgi:hypothetical protein
MKSVPRVLFPIFIVIFAAAPLKVSARTMADLPGVPVAGLRSYLPAAAYDRLIHAQIKAWIVVRGQIINNKIAGARVVHSEGNHVYDKVSLRMAGEMELYTDTTASRIAPAAVVNIFIFGLPNGQEDMFGYAQDESLGASNFIFSRSIIMRTIGLPSKQQQLKPATKKK